MGDLSKDFSTYEFTCQCGCGFDDVDPTLLAMLQEMRDLIGPVYINSGCRCPEHNKNEGAKSNSAHLTGKAADIECSNSTHRFKLLVAALTVGFERIGLRQTFIHLDVDETKQPLVAWLY